MPHVFEVADRIHIHRPGKRIAVIDPRQFSMSDAVAIMTGAMKPPAEGATAPAHLRWAKRFDSPKGASANLILTL